MKKVLALALAVLGFTAAQAVTVNWSGSTSGNLSSTVELKDWVGITYTFNSNTIFGTNGFAHGQTKDLVEIKSAQDASDGLKVSLAKSSGWWLKFAINGTEVVSNKLAGALTDNFELIFVADIADGKYDNMRLVWTNSVGATGTFNINGAYDAPTSLGYAIAGEGAGYANANVTAGVVPEPTALALLALGVAGLALKRKHA